jgi:DNA-binding response OmpR family regulator
MSTTLLLAEPEPETRVYLERHLRHDGFEIVAEPGHQPDLVLAGDDSDFERWHGQTPVIVLGSAEADPVDRVRAFRRGCDDYLSRPFHYDELVERIWAVLRRARRPESEYIVAGPIEIDALARIVSVRNARVSLSQKEFDLLARLAAEPQRVFKKDELLREVWGYPAQARTRTLDSHASRLRRKLREADPDTPFVENVWGVGYRLLGLV